MIITRFAVCMFSVGMIVAGSGAASGQDYPSKPVHIVTVAAGGGSDIAARLIAQGISGSLGQNVVVENRPGASGVIATMTVLKAPPDGYTLLFTGQSFWVVPLMKRTDYDPARDFSPVAWATSSPNALVVHPSLPVKNVKELIAIAKARPGALNYGSGSVGSAPHLTAKLFESMTGTKMVHVPYKGAAAAITDLIAGQLQLMFPSVGAVTTHVESGRLKALAVTSAQSTALLPGVPTVAASGLPGFVIATIDGVFAPAKTPPAVINRLSREIVRYLRTEKAKQQFLNAGAEAVGGSPEEFAAAVKSDTVIWAKVIERAGIRAD